MLGYSSNRMVNRDYQEALYDYEFLLDSTEGIFEIKGIKNIDLSNIIHITCPEVENINGETIHIHKLREIYLRDRSEMTYILIFKTILQKQIAYWALRKLKANS